MIRGRIAVRELSETERKAIVDPLAIALVESGAFRRRERWHLAIFIVEPGKRPRVTSRGDFAMYLRANDLKDQASEVLHRRVRPREILAWITLESEVVLATLRLDRGVWS